MQENIELVQKGFRILLPALSGFIGQEMSRVYRRTWWDEVLGALNDQYDLPYDGEYGQLVDSLDVANCLRLIERKWRDVFRNVLSESCRAWARELMGVRNVVSHMGQKDLEQPTAERALDTMALLCGAIDEDGCAEIRDLYAEVRARATDYAKATADTYAGLAQPETESSRGALADGSLLKLEGTEAVQKTLLTRKVTYGGKTVIYPVYRVRLDRLYYNDQNDRIATWITGYETENGQESLSGLSKDLYNRILENFIVDSNPESIQKTQKNIQLVGQREPGVTLTDGRIVDGNRRFTCLRRIQRESTEPVYFETVLMDMDAQKDKKQIKLLELAIQHGEEKKVDYDQIDFAIGTYRDIVQTKLLTVEEYAASANETNSDVKKRLEIAAMICEFLEYIHLPEQYHVAREYQVFSLFQEMMASLRQLDEAEQEELKAIVFNNVIMGAIPDQRKFIRDIKGLIRSGTYKDYFFDQKQWSEHIRSEISEQKIRNREDLEHFSAERPEIKEELQLSMERALLHSRSEQLRAKPGEKVSKCISLMMEVDPRLFSRMNTEEKETLKASLDELHKIVDGFKELL